MKHKQHHIPRAYMQHNWTKARRVVMRGCRRVIQGGAQSQRSAKIIWVDLMKHKYHTFARANMQHNWTTARRGAQWRRSAKIIWVDLMKHKQHYFFSG
jgi:hypothetical protein